MTTATRGLSTLVETTVAMALAPVVGSVGEVEDQRHHDNEHKQHGDLKHT